MEKDIKLGEAADLDLKLAGGVVSGVLTINEKVGIFTFSGSLKMEADIAGVAKEELDKLVAKLPASIQGLGGELEQVTLAAIEKV